MSRRPRLLDLFCCAGGAATGYDSAGFDVLGVDISLQPNYPFEFIQADAFALKPSFLRQFDAIHASPPCQHYSDLAKRNRNADDWPDLVDDTRDLLVSSGRPWIIENVEGCPLRNPVVLCGTMFPGLRVIRHRLFETSFPLQQPPHIPHAEHPKCHTLDKRKSHYGKTCEWDDFVSVNGGGNCSIGSARDAMGIDWMIKHEINQAIPPAYAEYVGRELLKHMRETNVKPIGSKDRIRLFLKSSVGEIVTSEQLQNAVPGVSGWARLLRQLRSDGWNISSCNNRADLKPGEFILEDEPPTSA